MNNPATAILTTVGRTFRFGQIISGQVLSLNPLTGLFEGISPSAPGAHAATHQDGGTDEINVTGLSGVLGDPQTPASHTHPQSDITGLVAALAVPTVKKIITANLTIPANYSMYVSGPGEVSAGVIVEIAAGAAVEIG